MRKYCWLLVAIVMSLALSACALEQPKNYCLSNEIRCTDDVFQRCMLNEEGWEDVVCGSQANPAPFCHVEHICVACNNDKDCRSTAKHCVDHACEPLSVEGCVAGTQTCKNSKVYTCSKKAWENGVICPEGCNAEGRACATPGEKCIDGTKRCGDTAVELCSDGAWKLGIQCLNTEVCNTETYLCETIICTQGAKRCGDDNAVQVCQNNAWKVEKTCENTEICNAETYTCKARTCTEGAKRCAKSNEIGKNDAVVEVCQNNAWKVETKCVGKEMCDDVTYICAIPPCILGTKRCNGNVVEACNASGEFKPSVQCAKDFHCLEVESQSTQTTVCVECMGTEKHCKNNAIETCVNNVWKITQACKDKVCNLETFVCEIATCQTGWKRCNGNSVEICNSFSKYEAAQPVGCSASNYCIENTSNHTTTCGECTKDEHCNQSQRCNTITNKCMYVE